MIFLYFYWLRAVHFRKKHISTIIVPSNDKKTRNVMIFLWVKSGTFSSYNFSLWHIFSTCRDTKQNKFSPILYC